MLNILFTRYKHQIISIALLISITQLVSLYIYNFKSTAPYFAFFHQVDTLFGLGVFAVVPFTLVLDVYRKGIKIGKLTGWRLGLYANMFLIIVFLPFEVIDLVLKAMISDFPLRLYWTYFFGSVGGTIILLMAGMILGGLAELIAKR